MSRNALNLLIVLFFATVFALTVSLALKFAAAPDIWRYGDWAINYSGGFVRRGLAGQIGIYLQQLTGISLPVILFSFATAMYGVFLWFFARLALAQKDPLLASLLVVAPFTALFHTGDIQGGFRKEIIALAILSVLSFRHANPDQNKRGIGLFSALAFLAIAIFTHEILLLTLPFFLFFVAQSRASPAKIWGMVLIVAIAAAITVLNPGTREMATAMCATVADAKAPLENCLVGGAIYWLGNTPWDGLDLASSTLAKNLRDAPLVLFLAAFAFFPLIAAATVNARSNPALKSDLARLGLCFGASAVMFAALSVVAADWGRFLYILLTCLTLTLLSVSARHQVHAQRNAAQTTVLVLILPFYAFGWSLLHFNGLRGPAFFFNRLVDMLP